jgi:hypothetical protein
VGLALLAIPGGALLRAGSAAGRQRRIQSYYEARLRRLDGSWKSSGDGGDEFAVAGHPYGADLDLFGAGSLFEYLCSARTGGGRRWLADVLLAAASLKETVARQEAVVELRERHSLRESLAEAARPGKNTLQGDALREWLERSPVKFESATRFLGAALCVLNLLVAPLGLAGVVRPEVPLACLAAVGLFSFAVWRKTSAILEAASPSVVYELELLMAYARQLRQERFTCALLKEATRSFDAVSAWELRVLLRRLKLLRWHEDPSFTYLSYLSLWAPLFAMAVERQRAGARKRLTRLAAAISELEGLASLAAYAFEHPQYPFPSFETADSRCLWRLG